MTAKKQLPPGTLAEAIRAARGANGWSQSLLARKLETTEKNIRNWESGRNLPSFPLYQRLSMLFGWQLPYSGDSSTARERSYAILGTLTASPDLALAGANG